MRVLCQGCHTTYDLPEGKEGQIGCPYCQHINSPDTPVALDTEAAVSKEGFDANKTVVAAVLAEFGEDTTQAKIAVAGKKIGLPQNRAIALVVVEGDRPGERIPLSKSKLTIGRKQADIVLNDPEASRTHCSITIYDDIVMVEDLGSANGTLVNNRVIQSAVLKNGDTLRVGMTLMKLSVQSPS